MAYLNNSNNSNQTTNSSVNIRDLANFKFPSNNTKQSNNQINNQSTNSSVNIQGLANFNFPGKNNTNQSNKNIKNNNIPKEISTIKDDKSTKYTSNQISL